MAEGGEQALLELWSKCFRSCMDLTISLSVQKQMKQETLIKRKEYSQKVAASNILKSGRVRHCQSTNLEHAFRACHDTFCSCR